MKYLAVFLSAAVAAAIAFAWCISSPVDTRLQGVLLLGFDQRPGSVTVLPDVIQAISIDFQTEQVTSLPVPRDLYISVNDYQGRINAIEGVIRADRFAEQDFSRLRSAVAQLVRFPIGSYVTVNMAGLQQIVDAAGGVDIEVRCPFSERFTIAPGLVEKYEFVTGWAHLNGAQALAYVRYRRTGGDLSRILRQQQLLASLQRRISDLGWSGRIKVGMAIVQFTGTNLSLLERLRIFWLLLRIHPQSLKGLALRNHDAVDHLVISSRQRVITLDNQLFAGTSQLPPLGSVEQECFPDSIRHGDDITGQNQKR